MYKGTEVNVERLPQFSISTAHITTTESQKNRTTPSFLCGWWDSELGQQFINWAIVATPVLISKTSSDVSESSAYVETDSFVFKDVTGLCGLRPASILADTDFETAGKKIERLEIIV